MDKKKFVNEDVLEYAVDTILRDIDTGDKTLLAQINSILNGEDAPLYFDSYSDFPTIGNPNKLYVDTNESKIYIYDSENVCYKLIACFAQNDIEYIQCTL